MGAADKAHPVRIARGHFDKYLKGDGIDVGGKGEPLRLPEGTGTVRIWDWEDGDGQFLATVPDSSVDFIHSSHSLEHMVSVAEALANWLRVLKPGGHLVIAVPDYVLYEKMVWPSVFNSDHKHSFSLDLTREKVGRDNHWHIHENLVPLLRSLGASVLVTELEDHNFQYNGGIHQQAMTALVQILVICAKGPLSPS
jgi:SAM-dependent methyltransferase